MLATRYPKDYKFTGVRYTELEQIIVDSWTIEGTVFDVKIKAQYAAAKLFVTNAAVLVKPYKSGWAIFYRKRLSNLA